MSRRLTRLLVLVVVILAFVGLLRLRTAGRKQGTLHVEHALRALQVGYQHTSASNATDGGVYNQMPLEEVIGAATPPTHLDGDGNSDLGFWNVLNRSYVDQHVPRPWIGSYQCKDVICSEFLYERDWNCVGKCVNNVSKKHINKVRPTLRPACHFMNGTSRRGVALLSFPGSGNTWLRGLLEKATGICTGEDTLTHWSNDGWTRICRVTYVCINNLYKVVGIILCYSCPCI